jgi:6-phosphogluconate dehydrogenase
MQVAMVGLGRMGSNMARRLMKAGHDVVAFDLDGDAVEKLESEGAVGARSLQELADGLTRPRAVWVMVPAAVTPRVVADLAAVLDPDDVIIDGGNSFYQDAVDTAGRLAESGIRFVDVGTSGGVHGAERGYCLMVGGERTIVERMEPLFRALAPGVEAAERTSGRKGDLVAGEQGYLHCGPSGAGHFVKMVHNGIEYGVMAAYAEGLNVLRHADAASADRSDDAETAPLRRPEYYRFDIDVAAVSEVWRRGSVIGSWLLDLTAAALAESPDLEEYGGVVSDSGEGRWTLQSAIEVGVPAPVLAAALFDRFASRGRDDFANQVLSAMREQFGGHQERNGGEQ